MKYVQSKSAGFNCGTIAYIKRNGVLVYCYGPTHTWHDDPCVTQKIESDCSPPGEKWGVCRFNAETENGLQFFPYHLKRTEMTPSEFAKVCEREGKKYTRIVDMKTEKTQREAVDLHRLVRPLKCFACSQKFTDTDKLAMHEQNDHPHEYHAAMVREMHGYSDDYEIT
jgi:hypothetical protein